MEKRGVRGGTLRRAMTGDPTHDQSCIKVVSLDQGGTARLKCVGWVVIVCRIFGIYTVAFCTVRGTREVHGPFSVSVALQRGCVCKWMCSKGVLCAQKGAARQPMCGRSF